MEVGIKICVKEVWQKMAGEEQDFWQNSWANKNEKPTTWMVSGPASFLGAILMLEGRGKVLEVVVVIHGQGEWQEMAS